MWVRCVVQAQHAIMLSQLESKLESLLLDIEKMPQEYVIRAEKERRRNVEKESVKSNKHCRFGCKKRETKEPSKDLCKLLRNVWVAWL